MIKNNGCCDLKYAIELKELGVKQESLWWWEISPSKQILRLKLNEQIESFQYTYYCAYTVAELGELLPDAITGKEGFCLISKGHKWQCEFGYYEYTELQEIKTLLADTMANCMALMVIFLIEHKYMEVGE